jgi:L-arabinokinase
MRLGDLPVDYDKARDLFRKDSRSAWAAYAAGAFVVLARERSVRFDDGAHILIASEVPEGKGVSSSAAIEVAVMQAVAAAFDISLEPRELALLCQMVENRVVGAPCGVMDQMTSVCGKQNHLLALLCQPAEIQGNIAVPDDIAFWGIDSGVRHSVSGADYGSVRVGAFMGLRILSEATGETWNGYLANISPEAFERELAPLLPERITGAEFLSKYGPTIDTVTQVDPDRTYVVKIPTAHPIYENFRVSAFAELLKSGSVNRQLEMPGELMYQSHASYSACGLGSEATDRLVELVREVGPAGGLYGAKITGGGSGGTVAILAKKGADGAVRAVADRYARESGRQPYIFTGSSPGAADTGVQVIN